MNAPSTIDRTLEDYTALVSDDQIRRLHALAAALEDVRVLHVNSAASGGGVAELLRSLTPVFDRLGVDTDWLVMEADDPFFDVTKSLHNGLQGKPVALTDRMKRTYRRAVEQNAAAISDEYDLVVLHDPQPLGMIADLADRYPDTRFLWRCHIDLTSPTPDHLEFVTKYVRRVDHTVFSHPAYRQEFDVPSSIVYPSIDPLAAKNRPLTRAERAAERERLEEIALEEETPLVAQVSRFDPWKGQLGLVEAYRQVCESVPETQLLLVGGMADDDPEGPAIYERILEETADDPDVHVLTNQPDTTVNFVQRRSDVVVQKSLREGFGLIVSETLWKRTPVVGSNVGGIPLQIDDGESGYLVEPDDVAGVVDRTRRLLTDERRRAELGEAGRERVRAEFLLPRQLRDDLEVFLECLGESDSSL